MSTSFFQNSVDIITLTVLLTLSVYHFIVYWRRKKYAEEHYNLNFSLFTAFTAVYLFFESPLFVLKVISDNIYGDWIPPVEAVTVFSILFNFSKFFSKLIKFPPDKEKYLLYGFYFLTASLSPTFISFLKGWNWYNQNLGDFVVTLTALYILFIVILFGSWIVKDQLYKDYSIKIITIGISILIFYLLSIKLFEIGYYPLTFRGNNFIIVGVVFLFAYILAEKFNMEYEELVKLKENLEQKIADRTMELSKAKEQIETVSRERSDFFINLAHETKTPLTIISNYLESYINKYGINEEIGIIKRNIDKLCKDMVDFLDLEKLIKGQLIFENNQIFSISGLLNEKTAILKEYARKKNLQLLIDIEENLHVKADPYLADRILLNLIENAIKYTPAGGEINISLQRESNEIVFIVSDTGIGISATKLAYIFEPYYQASHKKLNSQGIGMGLYIVKRSLELLNGSISVESIEDKGTTFTVKLPLYLLKEEEKSFSYTPAKHFIPDLKVIEKNLEPNKKSILLVEDNVDMLNYLITELSGDYNVIPAVNGIDAISKLNIMPVPALIISDIMMDKMDGEELYNKVTAGGYFKNIPFVFLTAKTQQEEKIKMLLSGAVDYIYKPFSITELKARIKTITENTIKQKNEGLKQAIEIISKQVSNPDKSIPDKQFTFEERCRQYDLTPRQKEIVILVAEGLEYKEIADKLNISSKTILNHINILFKKLDVHNKVDLLNKLYR